MVPPGNSAGDLFPRSNVARVGSLRRGNSPAKCSRFSLGSFFTHKLEKIGVPNRTQNMVMSLEERPRASPPHRTWSCHHGIASSSFHRFVPPHRSPVHRHAHLAAFTGGPMVQGIRGTISAVFVELFSQQVQSDPVKPGRLDLLKYWF